MKPPVHGVERYCARAELEVKFVRLPVALVVPNLAEFNLSQLNSERGSLWEELGPLVAEDFDRIGQMYGDQGLLWSQQDRVLVLRPGLDRQWLDDVCSALGEAVPPVIMPAPGGGGLIGDLLADWRAAAELRALLGAPRRVDLLCWGASRDLYTLIAMVRSWGHQVLVEAPEEEHYWTSGYLDSKLCCFDLRTSMPDVRGPRSWIASSPRELRGITENLLATAGVAIVKSPIGVGGEGFHLARADKDGM